MTKTYQLILIPEGSNLPEDLAHLFVSAPDIIQKVMAGLEKPVVVAVNTRELTMLVEYRDLFHLDCAAIIGLQGAMYNTVWNTYVATMERTTVDQLRQLEREANDARSNAGNEAVVQPSRAVRAARMAQSLAVPAIKTPEEPDASSFSADGAA